jgi:tannase/feruloyl esterase
MKRCASGFAVAVMLAGFSPTPPVGAGTEPCGDLSGTSLTSGSILSASVVEAGRFVPPARVVLSPEVLKALPAFCRVTARMTPSSDSAIHIEVWLPVNRWNQRLQAVGDGALAGFIPYALMAPGLAEGYAVTGTDTGHEGDTAAFMPQHPEQLTDFAYRSTHEMAGAAKALVTAFYGVAPRFSYYNACSGGGRHAITSAQRYPEDFQGIVAGAASWDQARLDAARIGINLTVNRSAESPIPPGKFPMIHRAVLEACDGSDGVADGVIENPQQCRFDFATLACNGPDAPTCLTAAQVETAKVLTSPFVDRTGGTVLLRSHLWPGSELSWSTLGGPAPSPNSLERVRRFHLKDVSAVFQLDTIASTLQRAVQLDGGLLASNNYDLRPFFNRGGKLLMYHGWSDPQVPPDHSIEYFDNVLQTVGPAARDSMALFMVPGMGHCGGGPGTDTFDKAAAIDDWVSTGRKPQQITASHRTNGLVDRSRPLCPYPQTARYIGTGSTDDASNFRCEAPR